MKRLFILLPLAAIFFAACHIGGHNRIKGNGTIKTESRSAANFSSVDVSGNIEVFVKQDSSYSVRVEADENLMSHINVRTEGDELIIEPANNRNLSGSKSIKVYVSAPAFKRLDASGASGITAENVLTGDAFDIDVSGASHATIELNAPKVVAELGGASHITLKGKTKDFNLEADGASHAKCFELLTENTEVDISGASSAEVFASVDLRADASGASHIRYKGDAKNYVGNASGAGSINKVN